VTTPTDRPRQAPHITVVGPRDADPRTYDAAFEIGRLLGERGAVVVCGAVVERGAVVVCGGLGGFMAAPGEAGPRLPGPGVQAGTNGRTSARGGARACRQRDNMRRCAPAASGA
jgi:hypothetical protein